MRTYYFLPWSLALVMLLPLTAQTQTLPTGIRSQVVGTIVAEDYNQLVQQYGPIKCSQIQVMLQPRPASTVLVPPPGQNTTLFPMEYQEKVTTTGNHLGLGCRYQIVLPPAITKNPSAGAYLYAVIPDPKYQQVLFNPAGWQNPLTFPIGLPVHRTFRNFVAGDGLIK